MTPPNQRPHDGQDQPLDPTVQAGLMRLGARDPMFWGWYLARLRGAHGLTAEQQADLLGLTPSALAYLSMCCVPRPETHAADLRRVADTVGVSVDALAAVLRQAADLGD